MKLIPVILSGGVGSRLWPLSREHYPKQLLPLCGQDSLLQATLKRLAGLSGVLPPLIVCNNAHRFMVAEQARAAGVEPLGILLEPLGRGTAPAVALAALAAQEHDPDPMLLVLPADHVIADPAAFRAAVLRALPAAESGKLATFGIVPKRPETGYGYIKAGAERADGTREVAGFVEKPDAETAARYLLDDDYYWNSGMFLFRAGRYLEELDRLAPAMLRACREAYSEAGLDLDNNFLHLDASLFTACPADSIDCAVMEQTQDAVVVSLAAGWSDIGAWDALWAASPRDEHDNVLLGDVLARDVRDCYLRADYRLLAVLGVEDLVVVETADAVLVANKSRAQEVKQLVETLRQSRRCEADLHRKVYRPWGTYEVLESAERFKVKRITVKPGASLSLQMHYHRTEHWVVVQGTARITRGEESFILSENQSTYMPVGVTHRLENPGKLPLEIIEIQSGPYLQEDDIVRLDDPHRRGQGE